jgi:hypothetical protein
VNAGIVAYTGHDGLLPHPFQYITETIPANKCLLSSPGKQKFHSPDISLQHKPHLFTALQLQNKLNNVYIRIGLDSSLVTDKQVNGFTKPSYAVEKYKIIQELITLS